MEILFPDGIPRVSPEVIVRNSVKSERKKFVFEKRSSGLYRLSVFRLNFNSQLSISRSWLIIINSETFLINAIHNFASLMENYIANNYFLRKGSAMIIDCFIIAIRRHR